MYNDHVATLHVPALTWSALQTAGWGMLFVEVWFHVANKYTSLNPITSDYVVASRFLGSGMTALVSGQAVFMQKKCDTTAGTPVSR
ncbi:hypothetical protein QBC37DRAFT_434587 [Rhypophila decipiens]|uniref:Uncharacterized protein n=1 Tax=Rhypophila decipiens TaxID=261697 RepID=A0AAN6XTL2_9PEZI|nr:hypothetical protein QBC37DRAFT_434587 [Rhypophila decipiens]